MLFSRQLRQAIGVQGPLVMILYLLASGAVAHTGFDALFTFRHNIDMVAKANGPSYDDGTTDGG